MIETPDFNMMNPFQDLISLEHRKCKNVLLNTLYEIWLTSLEDKDNILLSEENINNH